MTYSTYYKSAVGQIMITSDGINLTGLWLEGQKYFAATVDSEIKEKSELKIFTNTKKWLDRYFENKNPNISELQLAPKGGEFRQDIWKILCEIPYGKTITYRDIAQEMAKKLNKKAMSCQAVGGAVGHNPISIIIPCHRVIGTNGSLTGYAGGIEKKIKLLKHEGVNMDNLFVPKKSTAA